MNLQTPDNKPLCVFPVSTRAKTELHLYFDYPDQQPWLSEAVAQATSKGDGPALTSLLEMGPVGWGAPLGSFDEESQRIARASAVFVEKGAEGAAAVGGAVAHARCWAYWHEAEDGNVLRLELQAPEAFGWGTGFDQMAKEQMRGACLRQMGRQVESLLENVADPLSAERLDVVFTGRWDESMDVLRDRLRTLALATWHRVLSAEPADESDDEESDLAEPDSATAPALTH